MAIDYYDIERQVLALMDANSISPSKREIACDGRLHRYHIEESRGTEKSGAYKIYSDGWPAGWIQDWRWGGDKIYWKFDADSAGLTKPEKASLWKLEKAPEVIALRKTRQKEEEDETQSAIERARREYEKAQNAPDDHPYFVSKRVANYGLKLIGNDLIVPLYDENEVLQTYQKIPPPGLGQHKTFFTGAPASGGSFTIARDVKDGPVILCEGYATGATLYELTGYLTVCALGAGNLIKVAPALRKKYPKRKIIVAADDDAETAKKPQMNGKNPGILRIS
jgi:putative DNA primase/helicase